MALELPRGIERHSGMIRVQSAALVLALSTLTLTACQRETDPQNGQGASDAATATSPVDVVVPPPAPPVPVTTPSSTTPAPTQPAATGPAAVPTAASEAPLDTAALHERRDPERLLRFYAAALHARQWAAAARAWGNGSGVTAATLKASYDRAQPPELIIGKGEGDAGAGSLFYIAPVTLRFGANGPAQTGELSMRRVNDVDGATEDQLRWHIERSTIGAGQ